MSVEIGTNEKTMVIIDVIKHCHLGLVKDLGGHLVNQSHFSVIDKC